MLQAAGNSKDGTLEEKIVMSEKRLFPLAVTLSSASGGVAAPFSVVQSADTYVEGAANDQDLAANGQALPGLVSQSFELTQPFDRNVSDIIELRIEDMAASLNSLYRDAASTAQAFKEHVYEAFRVHAEDAITLFEDLSMAQGPDEVLVTQAEYIDRQFQAMARQAREVQFAFETYFSDSMRRAAEFFFPFQFWTR
jgi:hypothetical protein